MSGILALWGRQGQPVSAELLNQLLERMVCPAGDGQGVWHNGNIALAKRHFWVTSEEMGETQPLHEANLVIVGDVRLDNRPELGHQLQAPAGYSDTRLVLLAYQKWGVHCPEHLLGDFAFAIWDEAKHTLFAARDSLGCRNLCYYLRDGYCLLASEIAPLLAHPAVPVQLNEGKVAEYLVGLWNNQEESFYQDIFYCPPAHCLLISQDKVTKWPYWQLDPHFRLRYGRDEEYGEHFAHLLNEAVACRMRSTKPIGLSLSGGLDSTSIAAVAAGRTPQLHTFSYVFEQLASCDEREWIRPVVERYDLKATYLPADDQWTLRDFKQWPTSPDFIFHDAYAMLPLTVVRAAQQAGCQIVLNGHLGDTLFTGGKFWAADMLADWRQWGALGRMALWPSGLWGWRSDLFESGLRQFIPIGLRHWYRGVRPRPEAWPHPGLYPGLVERTALPARRSQDKSWQIFKAPGQWERVRALTSSIFAQGFGVVRALYQLLGVEYSSPFWDRRLVALVLAMPAYQLSRPGRTKYVLRQAMSGRLPNAVAQRQRKTSFAALFQKGLYEQEQATVKAIFANSQVVARQFIRPDWLQQSLANPYDPVNSYYLWLTLCLEWWLKMYW